MLSLPTIRAILQSYDLNDAELLCHQIQSYTDILLKWNKRISLTSVKDPEEIVRYHFAESFLAIKTCESLDGRLADVGTGAGFPGLALKLYVPALQVSLIESNSKKCAFLAEVIRSLQLEKVEVMRAGYEEIKKPKDPFELVTARALGDLRSLLKWAEGALSPDGRVLLWLGADGIETARTAVGHWTWQAPYAIPRTKSRFILVGSRKNQE
jgi:16S rRNA (guanine527-N7)-methyltransferase